MSMVSSACGCSSYRVDLSKGLFFLGLLGDWEVAAVLFVVVFLRFPLNFMNVLAITQHRFRFLQYFKQSIKYQIQIQIGIQKIRV
ncbi:hypothetical protein Taro_000401 [Colocasia esculenta]|uniref:Uncharacterized protein n=1 Tax=Colocasia esculenta TaxID=4460 RepID=A0A843T7T0_COLES|nr:hypothetical protein [Colocasia esculenta]